MNKTKLKIGVDVSKANFDVALPLVNEGEYKHKKFSNDREGFSKFLKLLSEDAHVIMEASGSYYIQLANFLYEKGIEVSVVNPLVISHFAKMMLNRVKTDKKDATIIAEYAKRENLPLWKPRPGHMNELQQLNSFLETMIDQRSRLKNELEAFTHSGINNRVLKKTLNAEIQHLSKKISLIEGEMERLIEENHGDLHSRLQTIPGIGKRTSIMLIVTTEAFQKFSNSKQLVCYIGLTPKIYQSGQFRGKSRISKVGMSKIRVLLYLCAMRAKTCNAKCREMFDRLTKRGKNGKLAMVAVAAKLLRQSWAVGTGQTTYIENFSSEIDANRHSTW